MRTSIIGLLSTIAACLAMQAFAATVTVTGALPAAVAKVLGLFDQLRAAQEQDAHGNRQRVLFRISEAEINDYMRSRCIGGRGPVWTQ